jgi:hypothetical protein
MVRQPPAAFYAFPVFDCYSFSPVNKPLAQGTKAEPGMSSTRTGGTRHRYQDEMMSAGCSEALKQIPGDLSSIRVAREIRRDFYLALIA